MTVGVDEVGRGSLAGPLCVAAVAWPKNVRLKGLNDSKLVPAVLRPKLAKIIRKKALAIGIGWASATQIDQLGLTAALKLAAAQAVSAISIDYQQIIIDGTMRLVEDPRVVTQIKADTTVPAVMAASIVAKVARDNYMKALHQVHGQYNFAKHVGYGTKLHRALLQQFGPCEIHRLSYAPVKAVLA